MSKIIEQFKNGEFAINCTTENQANKLAKIFNKNNIKWSTGTTITETYWRNENTCYSFAPDCYMGHDFKNYFFKEKHQSHNLQRVLQATLRGN